MATATGTAVPILYNFITVLSVSLSGYLSYHGLYSMFGELTLGVVVLLMSALFVTDMILGYYRTQKRPRIIISFVLLGWLFFACLSIASGFNYLYTNFMREDVERTAISQQLDIFRSDLTSTKSVLLSQPVHLNARNQQAELDVELNNLYNQVTDPLRPGCGEECRVHLDNVTNILGSPITNLAIPPIGSNSETVDDWYNRYRAAANNQLETTHNATDYSDIVTIVEKIDTALVDFPDTEYLIQNRGGLNTLSDMAAISPDIMRDANAIVPEANQIEHTRIDPSLGRLGEIAYSFQNGFGEMPNSTVTMLSILAASVIDIVPILLAFLLFGPGRLEKPEQESGIYKKRKKGQIFT